MLPRPLVSNTRLKQYEKDCKQYDEIIEIFKEIGSGKLSRRDVVTNVSNMVNNGLVSKLIELVGNIEEYEEE